MDMHGHQSKDSLTKFASNLHQHKRFDWAVRNFKSVVMQLVQDFPVSSVCEIGGGRSPTLQPDDARRLNIDIMINDILSEELKLLPGEFKTSCFDVSNRNLPESQIEKYDLVFSAMLLEHIKNSHQLHKNIYRMLRPGGISFHLHPLFFTVPFMTNYILPEALSVGEFYVG